MDSVESESGPAAQSQVSRSQCQRLSKVRIRTKKVLNVPLPKKVVIVRVYKIGIKKGIFTKIELLTKYISLWATHLLTAKFITSTEYRTYVAEINCLIVFYLVYVFFFSSRQ